jgi:hypothetical protein
LEVSSFITNFIIIKNTINKFQIPKKSPFDLESEVENLVIGIWDLIFGI